MQCVRGSPNLWKNILKCLRFSSLNGLHSSTSRQYSQSLLWFMEVISPIITRDLRVLSRGSTRISTSVTRRFITLSTGSSQGSLCGIRGGTNLHSDAFLSEHFNFIPVSYRSTDTPFSVIFHPENNKATGWRIRSSNSGGGRNLSLFQIPKPALGSIQPPFQ